MDYIFLNAHPSWSLSHAPVLSTFELDALKQHTSLIQTTVNKFLDDKPSWLQKRVAKDVLIELIKNRKLWIFVEGDKDYCLVDIPIINAASMEEWKLSPQDVNTVQQMLESDDVLLQLASQTTPAMRIGMIIWLVITSLAVQHDLYDESVWDKWDLHGRAITIWANIFSEITYSKKPPSEVILTDDDAVAAFKSAMDIAGHQHDYQTTPDLEAWATMRAALFPKLKDTELACWHFNDEDGCSLCDERFQEKVQSETGLSHMPPLHLVALWDYFWPCPDFEERLAFAVFQQPHLFLPEIVKPVEESLAQLFHKRNRQKYGLHYQLEENDSFTFMEVPPLSWKKIQDMIDSLLHFAPKCGEGRSFPLIEPIFWFDMVRVLGGQYQSQDKGKEASSRPRVSLAVAHKFDNKVFGGKFPPLNLDLLPEYVQRAVKRFCQATEQVEHTCWADYTDYTWANLHIEYRRRYAAAYALLYSTDSVPLLGDDDYCEACDDIGVLYDCVDAISAGQITLGSHNIAKVLGYIKQLAVISDDCKFTFPEDRSDVDDSNNISESSQRPDDQQQHGGNSEILCDETHDPATITENAMNHLNPTALTQPEAYHPVWQADSTAPQIYDNVMTGQGALYTIPETHASEQEHVQEFTNVWGPPRGDSEHLPFRAAIHADTIPEAHASEQEHVREFTNVWGPPREDSEHLPFWAAIHADTIPEAHASEQEHVRELTNVWGPPREDSEHLPFRAVVPDSSLGLVGLNVVPEVAWRNEQPPELMATSDVAGPSQPKNNVGPKISKEVKKRELHVFFVTLFKKHGVPLGTTGMAEARLPWKKMTNILADQGLEVVGWPDGVPKPRSDGKADKGISGFNTEHIAVLYQAMKAGQIDFRPLVGGSPTNDAPRVRQREDDMEEVEIRPSKKGKLTETRKMAKAFVAGKSVMKF